MSDSPTLTLCRYWVLPDKEDEFRRLLAGHWPRFVELGLVNQALPHLVMRGVDEARGVYYVETFPWRDHAAMQRAHDMPEVDAVWGPMASCCSSMEFPSVELVACTPLRA